MPLRLLISAYVLTATLPWTVVLIDRMAAGKLAAVFAAIALPALLASAGALMALFDQQYPWRGLCLALAAPVVVLPILAAYILGLCF